jgi:hypothetical protein
LPPEITVGVNPPSLHQPVGEGPVKTLELRKGGNRPAPPEFALPTETWREVVARRNRYGQVRGRLARGELREINDLITLNLDIRGFAQDVIENCEGPELLRAFWRAIEKVTILDPTCGSGAFLFAALNILEPLYDACLDRMEAFVADLDRSGEKHSPKKYEDFRKVLASVAAHPNHRYFILKSIILNNLFGVDIMEEAVEICKLRLFLKLAAQVEPNTTAENVGIEPLPDIDFNIRPGNTLVGYCTYEEVKRAVKSELDFENSEVKISVKAADLQQTFDAFRRRQVEGDASVPIAQKIELRERLKALEDELNLALSGEYGVVSSQKVTYDNWLRSHQPFHWFVEFHGIMARGGFDVIIGNPPYVASAKVRRIYNVKRLRCESCPDVYAWILERNRYLLGSEGRTGMIVPLSLGFSSDFELCRRLLFSGYDNNWFSSFGRIPSALFSFDVRVRNTIHIGLKSKGSPTCHTSRLHRWFEAARPVLFHTLEYAVFDPALWNYRVPKLNSDTLARAFEDLVLSQKRTIETTTSLMRSRNVLNFKKTAYNWLTFCRNLPPCYDETGHEVPHTKFGQVYFPSEETCELAMLLANGKLMLVFWFAVGDDFDVTRWNFAEFPSDFDRLSAVQKNELLALVPRMEDAMAQAVQFKLNAGRNVGNYNLAKCRDVTDQSDRIFSEALGFTNAWDAVELYYAQAVRTDFSVPGESD